jgi:hypothetical protein
LGHPAVASPFGLIPELLRDFDRIDPHVMPPGSFFIAAVVKISMMLPAQWNCELVTDFSAERTRLGEANMMCVRRARAA